MLDREPFLRAIFANPDDDLPRLVFADWLDEHGDHAWAELIRIQCELARLIPEFDPGADELQLREWELITQVREVGGASGIRQARRGFAASDRITIGACRLSNPIELREFASSHYPEWYGASSLTVTSRVESQEQIRTLLTSPVTEHVSEVQLTGWEVRVADLPQIPIPEHLDVTIRNLGDFIIRPAVTPSMISVLAHSREARRLTVLDLRNNNLDNDALRALAKSPHLNRLQRLYLSEGNTFRGRVWQQVLERFGPDVVE